MRVQPSAQTYTHELESVDAVNLFFSQILEQEALAINNLARNIPINTRELVAIVNETKGKIIFSGMGKSGAIAQKCAATFSSLGIPALFLHPSEALHGEMGVIQQTDTFIGISKSATGPELELIFSFTQVHKIQSALICCQQGPLCNYTPFTITLPFTKEACPLNLAPTSSSTMILAFGDALALCVSSLRGFNKQNFAQFHPAGALGKRLLLTVQNIMHTGQALPCIPEDALFQDVLYAITSKKLGTCIVTDKNNILQGIITDGDLRRACTAHGAAIFNTQARDIMTSNPKTTRPQELAINALDRMEKHNITSLIVTQDNKIQGLIHIHDLIKAGLSS